MDQSGCVMNIKVPMDIINSVNRMLEFAKKTKRERETGRTRERAHACVSACVAVGIGSDPAECCCLATERDLITKDGKETVRLADDLGRYSRGENDF